LIRRQKVNALSARSRGPACRSRGITQKDGRLTAVPSQL
jgi:hypothetical protein